MKYFIFFLLVVPCECFSLNSCEDKLQKRLWPIDCLLALKLKKEQKNSPAYEMLESWCVLYEDELTIIEPPEALFSLYLPPKCYEIALKSKKSHLSSKILKGAFLNSFL